MTDADFEYFRNAYMNFAAERSQAECRAMRSVLCNLLNMNASQLAAILNNLKMLEEHKKKYPCKLEEFNKIVERNFPNAKNR